MSLKVQLDSGLVLFTELSLGRRLSGEDSSTSFIESFGDISPLFDEIRSLFWAGVVLPLESQNMAVFCCNSINWYWIKSTVHLRSSIARPWSQHASDIALLIGHVPLLLPVESVFMVKLSLHALKFKGIADSSFAALRRDAGVQSSSRKGLPIVDVVVGIAPAGLQAVPPAWPHGRSGDGDGDKGGSIGRRRLVHIWASDRSLLVNISIGKSALPHWYWNRYIISIAIVAGALCPLRLFNLRSQSLSGSHSIIDLMALLNSSYIASRSSSRSAAFRRLSGVYHMNYS